MNGLKGETPSNMHMYLLQAVYTLGGDVPSVDGLGPLHRPMECRASHKSS